MSAERECRPVLLVLASTYPRWEGDPEPGFVHELAKRLTQRFHVIVLCPHANGAETHETMDGVEVIRYRYAPAALETLVNNGGIVTNLRVSPWKLLLVPGFVMMQAWKAWRLCRLRRIDVVHAHWLVPQGLVATFLGKPFLVTSHGADLYALRSSPFRTLKRFVLRKAHAATVVSSAMRHGVAELGVEASSVSVVPMGVDMTGRFSPGDSRDTCLSELLFVGRLVEKKGLRYLLDALPLVLCERPEVKLTIAGFGPDEEQLKAQVVELGLNSSVHFMGAVTQKELPSLYRRAALFVAPFIRAASGDQEGLPVALMEAVACGCPVIAGDVAGLKDIFGSDADECILDPRDTAAFAEAILRQLEDLERARERSLTMRSTLQEKLSWECVSARYSELLMNCYESRSPTVK